MAAECPHCGGEQHPYPCTQQIGPLLADYLLDHPEAKPLALVELRVARLREELETLTAAVHQRRH